MLSRAELKLRVKMIRALRETQEYLGWRARYIVEAVAADTERMATLDPNIPGYVILNSSGKRTKTTFGKYIRSHLNYDGYSINDKALKALSNAIIAQCNAEDHVSIASGEDLIRCYSAPEWKIKNNCMWGKPEFLRLYAENPHKIQLLTLELPLPHRQPIRGRALLWLTDSGERVVDRIYPADDGPQVHILKGWAERNNYFLRDHLDARNLSVTVKPPSNGFYPYLDTFRFATIRDDEIILRSVSSEDTNAELISTNGESLRYQHCSICNVLVRGELLSFQGLRYCGVCVQDRLASCSNCGHTHHRDNSVLIRRNGKVLRFCSIDCAQGCYSCYRCGWNIPWPPAGRIDDRYYCAACVEAQWYEQFTTDIPEVNPDVLPQLSTGAV